MISVDRLLRAVACVAALGFADAAHARNAYEGVTLVMAQRLSGGTLARADEPEQVKALVREVNAERGKLWTSYRGKPSSCAIRLTFSNGERRVGRLVLDDSTLIDFVGASTTTGMAREVPRFEMGTVRRFAARVRGPGCAR